MVSDSILKSNVKTARGTLEPIICSNVLESKLFNSPKFCEQKFLRQLDAQLRSDSGRAFFLQDSRPGKRNQTELFC